MSIISSIKRRIRLLLHKNRKYKNEEEFYTYFFTKHPSWSSPEPNEDETIRWREIEAELKKNAGSKTGLRILEIGCGRGWLSKKMSVYGTPVGIEPIEPVVRYAKKLFPAIEFHADTPVTFHQKHPDRSFDMIVSSEVLEHVSDKREFMEVIYRMMTPGACLILTTPRAENYEAFIKFYGKDVEQPLEEWLTESQMQDLLTSSGFTVLSKKFLSPLSDKQPEVLMTQLWTAKK